MRKPNLVIAGAVKGGTTSLYEYLGRHPDIGASRIKETCYFLPVRYGKPLAPVGQYLRHFEHCRDERYVMESTPGYLDGGKRLAGCMRSVLGPHARIVFSLRSPAGRLLSFFRYKKSMLELPKGMSLDEYLNRCLSMPFEQRVQQENDAYWGVDGGRYVDYLPDWFDVFGRSRVKVVFFEDLVADPVEVMCSIAEWLQVDSHPFLRARYEVENRTVAYRLGRVQKAAIGLNRMLEPTLRAHPSLKRGLRRLYHLVNSGTDNSSATGEPRADLSRLYRQSNQELSAFLEQQGYRTLPAWLRG